MSEDNKRSVLKRVFSTQPAESQSSYVKSYAYDHRYVLTNGGRLARRSVRMNGDTPVWLKKIESLGDYEKVFLNDILHAPSRIIAYRSGTGSGKSSLVRAINDAMATFALKNNWQSGLNCKSFSSIIDLQAADSADIGINASLGDEDNSDNKIAEHDRLLFRVLSDKIQDSLWELCSIEDFREILKKLSASSQFSRVAPYRSFINSIAAELSSDSTVLESAFETYLSDLESKQAFDLLLHLFLFIGHIHLKDKTYGKHKKSFVLFIDNSDKLHHVILTRLINHLKEFNANTEKLSSGLKIALFLRLSTSKDQIGAIPEADYRYYSSPEPRDIIINRSFDFILSENSEYSEYSEFDVIGAKFSVLELLIELLNGGIRDFSNSLDAISGTNIRNAFTHVIAWCASDDLKTRGSGRKKYEQELAKFAIPFLDSEAKTISKKFTNYLRNDLQELLEQPLPTQVKRIKTNLTRITKSYMSDSDRESGGINYRLRKFLVDSLSNNEISVRKIGSVDLDQEHLNDIRDFLRKDILGAGFTEPFISDTISECITSIAENIEEPGIQKSKQYQSTIILNYLSSLLKILSEHEEMIGIEGAQLTLLPKRAGGQNRFERTLLLYDVESDEEESTLKPVNLISVNDNDIQTCSLRIIYDLCEQQDTTYSAAKGVKYDKLRSRLTKYGYGKKTIRESMRSLTDLSSRLIYSRVADHHFYSSRHWERKYYGKPFFVSWAGYKYYESLISNPTYLQWMLINTASVQSNFTFNHRRLSGGIEVQKKSGSTEVQPRFKENMVNTLDGLHMLLNYEIGRLSKLSPRDRASVSNDCGSPVVDVIHRSALPIMRIINYVESPMVNSESGLVHPDEFEEVKKDFLAILKKGQDVSINFFGQGPSRWASILRQAENIANV